MRRKSEHLFVSSEDRFQIFPICDFFIKLIRHKIFMKNVPLSLSLSSSIFNCMLHRYPSTSCRSSHHLLHSVIIIIAIIVVVSIVLNFIEQYHSTIIPLPWAMFVKKSSKSLCVIYWAHNKKQVQLHLIYRSCGLNILHIMICCFFSILQKSFWMNLVKHAICLITSLWTLALNVDELYSSVSLKNYHSSSGLLYK